MLPLHWSSKTPTKYKRNVITGELHRAKGISNNFCFKVKRITKKFLSAGLLKILSEKLLNISMSIKVIM